MLQGKPTPYFKTYANTTSAIDCLADDPSGKRRPAIAVYVGGAGNIGLTPAFVGSSTQPHAAIAGANLDGIEFTGVASGGTATNIVIYWRR